MSDAMTKQERVERGKAVFDEITGESGQHVMELLADTSPELGRQIAAWAFGEMYQRPQLPPRDRQLVTLSVLTALGGCEPQLDVHINAALRVGLTPVEIVEAILHAGIFCGIPRAINATLAAKKVFGQRGLLPVES